MNQKTHTWAYCAIIALLFFSNTHKSSWARQFTNTSGKSIEAEIVSATEDTVTLKMAAGKTITAKKVLFSGDDQDFIAKWLEEHPAQINYKFDIAHSRKRLKKEKFRSGHANITRETWAFKLQVKNLCKDGQKNTDISTLKVSYRIYKSAEADSRRSQSNTQSAAYDGKYIVYSGSETIDNILYLKSSELMTSPVSISTSQLDPRYYYSGGTKSKKKDKLEGIWVKLFHNDREVGEYKSSGSALKTAIWK